MSKLETKVFAYNVALLIVATLAVYLAVRVERPDFGYVKETDLNEMLRVWKVRNPLVCIQFKVGFPFNYPIKLRKHFGTRPQRITE